MTTYGYCRVSSSRQAKEGISLPDQKRLIEAYCQQHDLGTPLIVTDPGVTSKVGFADREGGGVIIRAAHRGDHVVVTKIDRAFRNLYDFLHWFESWLDGGIHLHVINFGGNTIDPTTSIGRMVFRVLAVVAEMERDQVSERTRDAWAYFRAQGKSMTGAVPLGFKCVKSKTGGFDVVPDLARRKFMGQLLEMYEECRNFSEVRRFVNLHPAMFPPNHPPGTAGRKRAPGAWFTDNNIAVHIRREIQLREQEGRIAHADE